MESQRLLRKRRTSPQRRKAGGKFFSGTLHERIEKWSDLLIHEFAHEYESNHLSEEYYNACTRLDGKLARLMLEEGYTEAGSQTP